MKYLAPLPVTFKCRTKKQRDNLRSTRKVAKQTDEDNELEFKEESINEVPQATQRDETNTINIFCCTELDDAISGTFYTDMTRAFPVVSSEGMH